MRHPLVHKWPNDAEYRDRCPHAPTAARSRPARRPRSPTSWTGRRCQWSRRRRGRRTGGPRSPAPSALSKVTENGSSPAGRTTDPAHLPSTPDPGCCTSAGAERTHPTAVHIPSPQQIAGLASPRRIVRFMAMASSYPPSRQSHGPPQYFAGYPVRWVISPFSTAPRAPARPSSLERKDSSRPDTPHRRCPRHAARTLRRNPFLNETAAIHGLYQFDAPSSPEKWERIWSEVEAA